MFQIISMEKLIPLLNERHNLEWILWSNVNWDYLFVKWDKENKFYEEQIISKKFWFIKWLVENDKIDKDKLYNSEYKPYFWNRKTNAFSWFWAENILLMLLSISDAPIEDLISYLR